MASNYLEYQVNILDNRLNRPIADNTGLFTVLTAGTATAATVYKDSVGTAMTLPGTLNNGVARFFVDVSVTTVDIFVVTAQGHSAFMRGISQSNQNIRIDSERINYKLHIPFTTSLSGVVYSTGFSLSQNMMIKDAKVRITVADATALVDCGTTTAGVQGFVLGAICTVTGYRLVDESISGAEGWGSALSATSTNYAVRKYHRPANATSALPILFQNSTASGGTANPAQGFIILEYDRLVAP